MPDHGIVDEPKKKKTRWGCLALLLIPALMVTAAMIQDMWWERQPLSAHLKRVFRETGHEVPDYVTDISGSKGLVDFQGNFSATVSFTVRSEDIDEFMTLPTPPWKPSTTFRETGSSESVGDIQLPLGSIIAEERVGEYKCKYAVHKDSNTVYFYRASW